MDFGCMATYRYDITGGFLYLIQGLEFIYLVLCVLSSVFICFQMTNVSQKI